MRMAVAKTQRHTPPGWVVSETEKPGAEGFVKVSWGRGRGIAMMNGEMMTCLLNEWMKEEGNSRTGFHPMEGTWVPPRS